MVQDDLHEIISLIQQLDEFCTEQFCKLLSIYVKDVRNMVTASQEEQDEWIEALGYNIKTDLQNYIKQLKKEKL